MTEPTASSPTTKRRTSYVPPIFRDGNVPAPETACASCPASLWYVDQRLHCFCGTMKTLIWTASNEVPLSRCDGRQIAIARLRAAEAGK
jgi:hypothetical protein